MMFLVVVVVTLVFLWNSFFHLFRYNTYYISDHSFTIGKLRLELQLLDNFSTVKFLLTSRQKLCFTKEIRLLNSIEQVILFIFKYLVETNPFIVWKISVPKYVKVDTNFV